MRARAWASWLLLAASTAAWAQTASPMDDAAAPSIAGTGDPWVDAWLPDIGRYGSTYPQSFIDEVVRYHEAPRALVQDLLLERKWPAGDVYQACALADVSGRPCRQVADAWERQRGAGWQALARELGAEPGTPAFQRLKRGIVDSYVRWGRPIQVDASLGAGYPDLPRMPAPAAPAARRDPR